MKTPDQYRALDIWERRSEILLVRYRCLQRLSDSQFGVLSSDFYRPGASLEIRQQLDAQFLELLLEESSGDRIAFFPTVEEAIREHEAGFA